MIRGLDQPDAYPQTPEHQSGDGLVRVHETHISWVFAIGDFAYKVKKPIRTNFLDYSTLAKRRAAALEELRLDARFAPDLYLGVVPISVIDGQPRVGTETDADAGDPIDYAVKMRRFADEDLLSRQLAANLFRADQIPELAIAVADFHQSATVLRQGDALADVGAIRAAAIENFDSLAKDPDHDRNRELARLRSWTESFFAEHRDTFSQRVTNGFVRECHGDLHADNIVRWKGRWTPFDGIEFNDQLRWIDVIDDTAFLAMDFAARGHSDYGWKFINRYLHQTGDYESLELLRFYLTYRSMVRAKVAAIRASQSDCDDDQRRRQIVDCQNHIRLADEFSRDKRNSAHGLTLWITHGCSGSGKSTVADGMIDRGNVIWLRSDVERKRLFDLAPLDRSTTPEKLYSEQVTRATYDRLHDLANQNLENGYGVIVDATFLDRQHRLRFQQLADQHRAHYRIVTCEAEIDVLEQRVRQRKSSNQDASDADIHVLRQQLVNCDPLDEFESAFAEDGLVTSYKPMTSKAKE